MTDDDIPKAVPADNLQAAIALMQQFTMIIAAETAALRKGERSRFETLTAHKHEYFVALQQSLARLNPLRTGIAAADRHRWQEAATACEAVLRENAGLIEREQAHAATLMDELRAVLRERQRTTLTYGRDAQPRRRR